MAYPLLEWATAGDATDCAAWEALAMVHWLRGHPVDGLAACEKVLTMVPGRETTLFLAATLASSLKRWDAARSYAERAVKVNPWMWEYHEMLARAYAQAGDWTGAAAACRRALELNPSSVPVRSLLMTSYLRTGNKEAARAEFEVYLKFVPADQHDELRRRFAQQQR
jgi:Flp pilus assembly protein TadD